VLNSNDIMMKYPPFRFFTYLLFCIFIFGKSFTATPNTPSAKQFIVVIDPGHGGKDPGAVSKGVREKDVVLAIGKKLGSYINEGFPEVKVIFTRYTDVFVPLIDRSNLANKNKANLFISLHANFCGTPSTKGTETYVLGLHRSEDNLEVAKKENSVILLEDDYSTTYEGFDPNLSESYIMFELTQDIYMDQSLSFADAIQQQFKSNLENSNRGVKQAGFLVLRQSSMPSVLVETGFISSPSEAAYLSSESGQQAIAQSVFEAFKHFKIKNSGSNAPAVAENKPKEENPKNQEKKDIAAENQTKEPEIKPEPVAEVKSEIIKPEPVMVSPKPEPKKEVIPVEKKEVKPENNPVGNQNTYYSVQIGANTTPVEPIAANFKGLKDVRREKTDDKYYRYFVGKETTLELITPIWQQIKLKFPQSFIVSFVDGKRFILDQNLLK
jgi:N-acetylmuramoyl-L-alanine amidase